VYSFNRILNGKVLTALVAAGFMTAVVGCVPPNATAVNSGAQVAPGAETGDPGTFAEAPITEEELEILRANFNRVHFEFDVATFDETTRDLLAQNAAILMRHSAVTVRIEGHADHFGSDEYNLALGQRRAEVVRSYLIALGVQSGPMLGELLKSISAARLNGEIRTRGEEEALVLLSIAEFKS
jgi:peptidoglycan-associated lipoprotein